MSNTDAASNVPVILHSISNEHKIPEEMYMIPSTWKRFQLSQLINSLLDNAKAVPFDFFVGEDSSGGKLTSLLSNYSNGVSRLFCQVQIYSHNAGRNAAPLVHSVNTPTQASQHIPTRRLDIIGVDQQHTAQ